AYLWTADAETARRICEEVRRRTQAAQVGAEPASTVLRREGRDIRQWLDGLRVATGDDYRSNALGTDEPVRVLGCGTRPPEERAAAAYLLRAKLGDEARPRIRVALEECASPQLRIALEAIDEGEDDAETAKRLQMLARPT